MTEDENTLRCALHKAETERANLLAAACDLVAAVRNVEASFALGDSGCCKFCGTLTLDERHSFVDCVHAIREQVDEVAAQLHGRDETIAEATDLLRTMWREAEHWHGEKASSHFRSTISERLRALGVET